MSEDNGPPHRVASRRHEDRESLFTLLAIAFVLAAQLFLVFMKSLNWDEFLHYSQVFDLPRGRVIWATQTLHARLFAWAPLVSHDVIDQLLAARVVMLCFEAAAAWFIVLLARQFVDRQTALLAGLVYLAGGYVVVHGFSFRPDPMAAATLMASLYMFARRELSPTVILLAGILIGLAGVITIKSIIYLPCFAGAAYFRFANRKGTAADTIARIAAVPIVAAIAFYAIMSLHRLGTPLASNAANTFETSADSYLFGELFHVWRYTVIQALVAPVLAAAILITPWAIRRRIMAETVMIVGLLMPLLTLIFYRNAFPYFFVFLLPPVCVAISPSIAILSHRYRTSRLLPAILVTPIVMLAVQNYSVLPRQRTIVAELHRLFPEPTGYLSYTGFVPDFPRIIPHLISGVGLQTYYRRGEPVIAEAIERGEVGFVLADNSAVLAGLMGQKIPYSLRPQDFTALHENFLPYEGAIWIAGKHLCAAPSPQSLMIYRPGVYTLEEGRLSLDGRTAAAGDRLTLAAGPHRLFYPKGPCLNLWALPAVPHSPIPLPVGPLMTQF